MGDRGNVFVNGVYLYTHWDGSELPKIVKSALSRKLRWDDGDYLARIIFSEMIKDDIDRETGYGLSNKLMDDDNPTVEVDVNNQTIQIGKNKVSFEEFIA